MGWRFRRSVGLGPLRLNMSKSGLGYSWGVPGIRVSTTPNGRRYLWLSLPGTGLAWSKEIGRKPIQSSSTPLQRQPSGTKVRKAIKEQRQLPENVERPILNIFPESTSN
jgi:hypothetical protein